jgi:hypothetical protein
MGVRVRVGRGRPWRALVLASAVGIASPSSARALGDNPTGGGPNGTPLAITGIPVARESVGAYRPVIWAPYSLTGSVVHAWIDEQLVACRPETRGGWGSGTLGYGGHGVVPGYYGFGLGYHLGYGYGGHGLGVGAEGGYPYYGGPGYRCGGQFYDGGPAYSGVANALIQPEDPALPNAGMGDDPSRLGYRSDFGPFTGASPYPYIHHSPTAEGTATGPVNAPAGGVGPSLPDPTAPGPAAAF